jgi:hypothetical protein
MSETFHEVTTSHNNARLEVLIAVFWDVNAVPLDE